ncbi:bifunctional protein-serine/threonine kinase/phosphatase [Marinomonas agarivorans]|nr:bifunctional protein-serine/threonine kinase/phosphatase [Marinomonas agarivorans]
MTQPLSVSIGSASDKGIKSVNQDFMGSHIPPEPMLSSKGIALVMADGISSSRVSQQASQTAVTSFLADYYCTSEAWSVKTAAQKVMQSINTWLYAQTRNSPYRYEKDKGYICTFSALILKSNTAHVFHSGDTRVYRLAGNRLVGNRLVGNHLEEDNLVGNSLEQLTEDHRRVVSSDVTYLTRALGIDQVLEVDYRQLTLEQGDIYLLATDGVYEFIKPKQITNIIRSSASLDLAANTIIQQALNTGSQDNLSIQIVQIQHVPDYQLEEIQQLSQLPTPTQLTPRMQFDGYEILRAIHISSRSHVFLASDIESHATVVIKTPSAELRNNTQHLENLMLEEWIAKRINSPYVAKAITPNHKRHYLYLTTEYIEGTSLHQWMIDHPTPNLHQVRDIIVQVGKGLQTFHRQEMVHQDIRPQNILIDHSDTVKIIDFGSTFIAGVTNRNTEEVLRGTLRYSAPEYFLGATGTQQSDIYSLAVIMYQMLSGRFPYGNQIASANSRAKQNKLRYRSLIDEKSELPVWLDDALKKALQPNPLKRYQEISEFLHDIRTPNNAFLQKTKPPLLQRNPVMFWQIMSFILLLLLVTQQALLAA